MNEANTVIALTCQREVTALSENCKLRTRLIRGETHIQWLTARLSLARMTPIGKPVPVSIRGSTAERPFRQAPPCRKILLVPLLRQPMRSIFLCRTLRSRLVQPHQPSSYPCWHNGPIYSACMWWWGWRQRTKSTSNTSCVDGGHGSLNIRPTISGPAEGVDSQGRVSTVIAVVVVIDQNVAIGIEKQTLAAGTVDVSVSA